MTQALIVLHAVLCQRLGWVFRLFFFSFRLAFLVFRCCCCSVGVLVVVACLARGAFFCCSSVFCPHQFVQSYPLTQKVFQKWYVVYLVFVFVLDATLLLLDCLHADVVTSLTFLLRLLVLSPCAVGNSLLPQETWRRLPGRRVSDVLELSQQNFTILLANLRVGCVCKDGWSLLSGLELVCSLS